MLCPLFSCMGAKVLNSQIPNVDQLCPIILNSMHKCTSYDPDKLKIRPFYHLTFKCDSNFQPTWTNVSNEQLCKIILKSMNKCWSYGPGKFNLWPFYNLTIYDLQVWHWPSTYLSNCFKWTSVPDYFETNAKIYKLWPTQAQFVTILSFDLQVWPFNLLEQMFQMNNCIRLFWSSCINAEVMVQTSSMYDHFIIWP